MKYKQSRSSAPERLTTTKPQEPVALRRAASKERGLDESGTLLNDLPVKHQVPLILRLQHTYGNQQAYQMVHQVQRKEAEPESGVADQIATQDIQYEFIAHHLAYQDEIPGDTHEIIRGWGYVPQWASRVNDASTGLFVGLLLPDEQHQHLRPILAFRGTAGYRDILADADPRGIGYDQFDTNQAIIGQLIAEAGGAVDVTGHSLGGALAQRAGVAFPDSIGRIVTFQAPGIGLEEAMAFDAQEGGAQVTHHMAYGDIVDTAGEQHLDGDFFMHSPGHGPLSHSSFLLTVPELKARREALGLTDAKLESLGIAVEENYKAIEHHDDYPFWIKNAIDESARSGLGSVLYPILGGLHVLFRDDDADIRAVLAETSDEAVSQMPVSERSYVVDRLRRGVAGDADEQAILRVLRLSAENGDLVSILQVVNAHDLAYAIDGAEYDQLRELLNEHYYAQVDTSTALTLVQACIDGDTAEWEEEMIADLLVVHPESRSIITQIGAGDFHDGLNTIEWQLDGADQDRVEAVHGTSGKWF